MKAAVLHAPNQPLTHRGHRHRKAQEPRGAGAHRGGGPVPQRPALHRRAVPASAAGGAGPRGGGRRRGGRRRRQLPQARRPRDQLPVGVLRALRVLHQRPPLDLPDAGGEDAARHRQAAVVEGQAPQPVRQPVGLRRADGRARACAGEDPLGHAARPGRADRLQRDHRLRRDRPHRQDGAGRHGGRVRRRRHRAVDHQRGPHRRRQPHHRHRQGPVQAQPGQALRRHRHHRRQRRRHRRQDPGADRLAACTTPSNASA